MQISKPIFFKSQIEFRRWLARNHDRLQEVWVGFYKKGASKKGITYQEALDEALCFGWIDGIRKNVDAEGYTNRFTPRKPRSNWSDVNIRRAKELIALGRMKPVGLRVFRQAMESLKRRPRVPEKLNAPRIRELKKNRKAWEFFRSQSASYQRLLSMWIMSAKKEETRDKRFRILKTASAKLRRIDILAPGSSQ